MPDTLDTIESPPLTCLLVPLDGSRLAEAVLPAVEALAERFAARVVLIHVLEARAPATVHGERHLMDAAEAERYLAGVAERLHAGGIVVEMHVHAAPEGDLAGSVVEHAEEFQPDLVVLCAHGRGGLRDLLYGRIAQQALQRGTRPILVIQPNEDGSAPPFAPRRILVPLDGRHRHAETVELAAALARAFGATLDLAFVVPTLGTLSGEHAATGVLLPGATRAVLDMGREEAKDYLERVAGLLRARGLAVRADVLRGSTVSEVLQHAEATGADLVVLTSHGRAGLSALLSGSVAARIAARTHVPLLLVRA